MIRILGLKCHLLEPYCTARTGIICNTAACLACGVRQCCKTPLSMRQRMPTRNRQSEFVLHYFKQCWLRTQHTTCSSIYICSEKVAAFHTGVQQYCGSNDARTALHTQHTGDSCCLSLSLLCSFVSCLPGSQTTQAKSGCGVVLMYDFPDGSAAFTNPLGNCAMDPHMSSVTTSMHSNRLNNTSVKIDWPIRASSL